MDLRASDPSGGDEYAEGIGAKRSFATNRVRSQVQLGNEGDAAHGAAPALSQRVLPRRATTTYSMTFAPSLSALRMRTRAGRLCLVAVSSMPASMAYSRSSVGAMRHEPAPLRKLPSAPASRAAERIAGHPG